MGEYESNKSVNPKESQLYHMTKSGKTGKMQGYSLWYSI